MAMTKKERAEFDAALQAARVAGALRSTSEVPFDLLPPQGPGEISGWVFNAYSASVHEGWSDSTFHGSGAGRKTSTSASQNPRRMHSTKLLALRALRHAVEEESALKLAKIDEQIEREEQP